MKLLTLSALQRQKLTRFLLLLSRKVLFFLNVVSPSSLLVFLKFNLLSRQLIKYEISNAIELVHFVMNLRKEKIVAYIQTSLQNNLYFSKQLIILFKILRVITSVFLIIS